jgi:Caspase domain
MTDFAVVVGIARYPQLSAEGVAVDLDGPDNDALAVRDWLVDPNGGMLQPANVRLVRSADFDPIDPNDPEPAKARIERELSWVEQQTAQAAGNRLYLYFSGHGFSPVLEEGALFTAEASQTYPQYVYAHAWLRWFRRAQRFRETVLWMDSCMNYEQSIPVNEVLMRPKIGTGVPGPAFMALAAQTKNALEHTMSDGKVHGVFTWTLLQGLRGGAADERARVTGESLRSFLYTVMPEFLPASAVNSTSVDLHPFVRADEGMVFRRLPARPKYRVRLVLPPAAVGTELRLWTGRPLAQVVREVPARAEWTGRLLRGLYVAEVPAAGLRHGFQVSGAGAVEEVVSRTGPPVRVPDGSELFSLDVVAGNPAAAISVMDSHFDRIFSETGGLHEQDIPGVYKVRVEFGRDITMISDDVLLLDRDNPPGLTPGPQLSSPAPIPGTESSHEFQAAPFEEAADRRGAFTGPVAGLSTISVLVRYWTEPGGAAATDGTAAAAASAVPRPHPMQGLQLLDTAGHPVADLSQACQVEVQNQVDPVAVWEREVPPGAYYLRQALPDGQQYEGCVIASADWVTQVAIQRTPQTTGTARIGGAVGQPDAIGDVAVFMRRASVTREPGQDAVIEGARLALTQGRNLFGEGHGAQLTDLLLTKFADPIAGIIGGHLLLQAMDMGQPDAARAQQLDSVVANLRSLVGLYHPDVEALSLRCTDKALRTSRPFTAPPMFRHSWQLITEASYERPELIPVELWQRVHASAALGAFFVWAADERTRAAHAAQLSRWISQYADDGEAQAASEEQIANGSAEPPASMAPAPMAESAPAPIETAAAAAVSEPAWQATALPEAAREAAQKLQVPARAAAALWAERNPPQAGGRRQADV